MLFEKAGEFAIGSVAERQALYRRCEAEASHLVMKAFSGGQLLQASTSPFGRTLTEYQCIQYALDKPGVLTVLPGVRNREDLQRILGFTKAAPEERDYSVLGTFTPREAEGACVYCNHCQPCPVGWMWADQQVLRSVGCRRCAGKEPLRQFGKHAGDCVGCRHCDARCPFHVHQSARMQEIRAYFGR